MPGAVASADGDRGGVVDECPGVQKQENEKGQENNIEDKQLHVGQIEVEVFESAASIEYSYLAQPRSDNPLNKLTLTFLSVFSP